MLVFPNLEFLWVPMKVNSTRGAIFSLIIVFLIGLGLPASGIPGIGSSAFAQENAQNDTNQVAQPEEDTRGLDERIDDAFKPVSDWWGALVFTPVPIGSKPVPIVVIILVVGAGFFTIYFGFINIRLFPFAIKVVSGHFDSVEKGGESDKIKHVEVQEVDGDLVDTIRDESHGEVSHFQALATAVSGTVGLGNIAGVAVAIATGGPGATSTLR